MNCGNCGNAIQPHERFCSSCGHAVNAGGAAPAAGQTPPPPPMPGAPPAYGQPPPAYGQPPAFGQQPPPYQPPGAQGWGPGQPGYGPPPEPGNGLSIGGIVCGAIAFLFCPILLGPIAIVLGIVARSKGERLANVAIGVGVAGLVGGLLLSVLVMNTMG